MARITKFGPQFGKPKGPRMPAMKARAPKMPGVRKFTKGGESSSDDELSLDNLSFGKAFNAVRNYDPSAKTFTWRGKKYSTAMAAPKAASTADSEPVNKKAEAAFRGMESRATPKATSNFDKITGGVSPSQRDYIKRNLGTLSDPLASGRVQQADKEATEQLVGWLGTPEMKLAEGAVGLGAATLGGKALVNRMLSKGAVDAELAAGARMAGEADKGYMIRKSQALAEKKAAAAQARADAKAAEKEAEVRRRLEENEDYTQYAMKRGGKVKRFASGGSVSSASRRGDGCATKGKTKGRFV